MTENKWRDDVEKTDIPIYSFRGYLIFAKGDKRLFDQNLSIQDDPMLSYLMTIGDRLSIINNYFSDVLKQSDLVRKEDDELKQKGHIRGTQRLLMAQYYHGFLNAIYSLMENLAFIVGRIYRKENLPQSFRRQKSRIIDNPTVDPVYAEILSELSWYDELRTIRDEYTHFLTGMINSNINGKIEYINKGLSSRKGAIKEITNNDVVEHASNIKNELELFLDKLGKDLIDTMDKNVRIAIICGITPKGLIGAKLQSYNDVCSNNAGICKSFKFNCPEADTCQARKNTDLNTGLEIV